MQQLLLSQYELIKSARHALFAYCDGMYPADLFKQVSEFNNSSIADLLVHSANTYISWINNFGLDGNLTFYQTENVKGLYDIRSLFEKVDLIMAEFLDKYSENFKHPITAMIKHRGFMLTLDTLQLYTHVITHEFHHKGQILTMSRLLGYTPVDTDVIRT